MRRSLAFLLAIVISWLLVLPVFAVSTAAKLPACCRKNGKHHCQMMETSSRADDSLSALKEKCPCFPQASPANHVETFRPATRQAVFAGLVSHPACSPQTEAGYRASYYRSKQKRGPPIFLS
jgi:hypothetical protein